MGGKTAIRIIERTIHVILGFRLGKNGMDFIKNLSFVTVAVSLASLLNFIIVLFFARMSGPEEFGKFGLVLSLSTFLIIPMIFGLDYTIAKNAKKKNLNNLIRTATGITAIMTIITAIILFLAKNALAELLKTQKIVIFYSILLSVILAFYYLRESVMKAKHDFRRYTYYKIIMSLTTFLIIAMLVKNRPPFQGIVIAFMMGYLLFIFLTYNRHKTGISIEKKHAKFLLSYAVFAALVTLSSTIYQNTTILMLNYLKGASTTGIFYAYYRASMIFSWRILEPFLFVFFPVIASTGVTKQTIQKINRVLKRIWIFVLIGSFVITLIILKFLGNEYSIDYILLIMMATASVIFIIQNIYLWLINASGIKGIKKTAKGLIIICILFIPISFLLINELSLHGAGISLLLVNLALSIYYIRISRRIIDG